MLIKIFRFLRILGSITKIFGISLLKKLFSRKKIIWIFGACVFDDFSRYEVGMNFFLKFFAPNAEKQRKANFWCFENFWLFGKLYGNFVRKLSKSAENFLKWTFCNVIKSMKFSIAKNQENNKPPPVESIENKAKKFQKT